MGAKVAYDERAIARTRKQLQKGSQQLQAQYNSGGASDLEQITPPWTAQLEAHSAKSKKWTKLPPKKQLRTLKKGLKLMQRQVQDVRSAMQQQEQLIKETELQIKTREQNY